MLNQLSPYLYNFVNTSILNPERIWIIISWIGRRCLIADKSETKICSSTTIRWGYTQIIFIFLREKNKYFSVRYLTVYSSRSISMVGSVPMLMPMPGLPPFKESRFLSRSPIPPRAKLRVGAVEKWSTRIWKRSKIIIFKNVKFDKKKTFYDDKGWF